MNAVRACVLAVVLGCAAPVATAQDATQRSAGAAQPALAGEYHLDGVMETGSGLLLRQDGTFEWYFTYGALDLAARGKWSAAGDGIDLAVAEMGFPPQFPETQFDRMHLRIDGADLVPSWPWDMDAFRKDTERGAYVRE